MVSGWRNGTWPTVFTSAEAHNHPHPTTTGGHRGGHGDQARFDYTPASSQASYQPSIGGRLDPDQEDVRHVRRPLPFDFSPRDDQEGKDFVLPRLVDPALILL